MPDRLPVEPTAVANLLADFRRVRHLRNHWTRTGPRVGYYWYVTFDQASDVLRLVRQCQDRLSFPYYDLVPPSMVHLTLDRIAYHPGPTADQLEAIASAARERCRPMMPFTITVAILTGTGGAIGLNVFPPEPVLELRQTLRAATLSVMPNASVTNRALHPHVTVAYANTDGVPATAAHEVAEQSATLPPATARVDSAAMVRLERRTRSYHWDALTMVPLGSQPG
ncbi:MAG: 2'-5' RNA ligase family protein [Micromonosporaceae bacterium]|nr:2'-5' RNA ligase family protein [Micromonosporaceae bacterium]